MNKLTVLQLLVFFIFTISQLTQAEKDQILSAHNNLRARVVPAAQTMPNLVWDTQLESIAQTYVAKCISSSGSLVDHNPDRAVGYPTSVGENIYASTATVTNISVPVQSWWNENQFYNYDTNTCQSGKVCGHYTQVVWANSLKLGCGKATCNSLTFKYNVLCNYGPAGNFNNQKPYVKSNGTQTNPTPNPTPTPTPTPNTTTPNTRTSQAGVTIFPIYIIMFSLAILLIL